HTITTLHKHKNNNHQVLNTFSQLHIQQHTTHWPTLTPINTPTTPLPTYPFQHNTYWINEPPAQKVTDDLGLTAAEHPLLAATTEIPSTGSVLFTGRISIRTHPWLTEHAINNTILMPGSGLIDLAAHVGTHTGTPHIQELTLENPLVIPDEQPIDLHVTVEPADDDGRRTLTIHTRLVDGPALTGWTRHAVGALTAHATAQPSTATTWPPPDAAPVDLTDFYARLAERGYHYGPTFQGLTHAWRHDNGDLYAEIALPEGTEITGHAIHPALLDAALHPLMLTSPTEEQQLRLPFSWQDVSLLADGATVLRVHLHATGAGQVRITATDAGGTPVIIVDALDARPIEPDRLRVEGRTRRDDMFVLRWETFSPAGAAVRSHPYVLIRGDENGAMTALAADATEPYPDLASLGQAIDAGTPSPELVLVNCPDSPVADVPASTHELTGHVLETLRTWLTDERFADKRLVLITQGAVSTNVDEGIRDLAQAAVWGMVRTAQAEHPGRIVLLDLDLREVTPGSVRTALSSEEPQLAVRQGRVLVPRVIASGPGDGLVPPTGSALWRLENPTPGTLDNLTLAPWPDADAPLRPGQVRVSLRAAGLNFRDALAALGMVNDRTGVGGEGAGIVTEVGADVESLAPGDRVMGLFRSGIGPVAVTDHRLITRIPSGWSYAEAAAVPVAFLTAYQGLKDLAKLRKGETLLVHTATGGVGSAAVQLARHWGAHVLATASPAKWRVLQEQGIDGDRLASSRTLDFETKFRDRIGGRGVDVVLNSLAHEFTDASLRLLGSGGRFIEMGKTDIRESGEVEAAYPGVKYHLLDLHQTPSEHIEEMLGALSALFEEGVLQPPPVTTWDVRHAARALRHLSQARHIGKVVLTIGSPLDPEGTVLITGGTGVLGSAVARHLVAQHNARHLLLASRSGPHAPSATELHHELTEHGAQVTITSCDTSKPEALTELLDTIPHQHPLTAVIHAAGTLQDATITQLTNDQLDAVLTPKADAAWHLHQLTKEKNLSAFVLFSSLAGTLGSPGQANYAAANTFLDALAHHRHTQGLPATSLAWGLWQQTSNMTAHLTTTDHQRITTSGISPLSTDQALRLLDETLIHPEPHLIPANINTRTTNPHPLLQSRAPTAPKRSAMAQAPEPVLLTERLAELPSDEQYEVLLETVRGELATVLGHATTDDIGPDSAFKELGLDSLTAVELRNRLNTVTGLRLSATLAFDHPTPQELVEYLRSQLVPEPAPPGTTLLTELDELETSLSTGLDISQLPSDLAPRLQELLRKLTVQQAADGEMIRTIKATSRPDELFALIDQGMEDSNHRDQSEGSY
ncbi:SDR family NAD(P)-dependent oxidoreductase, partial [Actinoallomurus oryzae]|uniref:SDR family NAD(P)-dependent oxidoreductase n=1 Tax=Actinoallomurus oryzae TaxID=502180 RepID=UPI0031ED53F1